MVMAVTTMEVITTDTEEDMLITIHSEEIQFLAEEAQHQLQEGILLYIEEIQIVEQETPTLIAEQEKETQTLLGEIPTLIAE
jgi:hypothetical protein